MGGKTWKSNQFTSKCATEDGHKLWETLGLNETGKNDCLSESNRRNGTSSRTNRSQRLEMVTLFLSPCPLGCCSSSWRLSRSSEASTRREDTNLSALRLPGCCRRPPGAGGCRLKDPRSPQALRSSRLVPALLPLYCTIISLILALN